MEGGLEEAPIHRAVMAGLPEAMRGALVQRRGPAEFLARGLEEALTHLDFPWAHQQHIKSSHVLERVKRWWGSSPARGAG